MADTESNNPGVILGMLVSFYYLFCCKSTSIVPFNPAMQRTSMLLDSDPQPKALPTFERPGSYGLTWNCSNLEQALRVCGTDDHLVTFTLSPLVTSTRVTEKRPGRAAVTAVKICKEHYSAPFGYWGAFACDVLRQTLQAIPLQKDVIFASFYSSRGIKQPALPVL
jgi:hypothetical protein